MIEVNPKLREQEADDGEGMPQERGKQLPVCDVGEPFA